MEKHLKGLIVERCGTFPPRTHDLTKLVHVAKVTPDDGQDLSLRTLTEYYVGTRYPEKVRALADGRPTNFFGYLLAHGKPIH